MSMKNDRSRVLTSQTPDFADQLVTVKGWIHARRDHGKLIFIDVRDRSGLLQVVFNPQVSQDAYNTATELKSEFAVEITGKVNKRPERLINPKLASGTVEL